MTKKIIFIVFCMVSALASAQHRFPPIDLYTGDPTGVACTVPNSMVQSTTTGSIYTCLAGVYVGASGGGGDDPVARTAVAAAQTTASAAIPAQSCTNTGTLSCPAITISGTPSSGTDASTIATRNAATPLKGTFGNGGGSLGGATACGIAPRSGTISQITLIGDGNLGNATVDFSSETVSAYLAGTAATSMTSSHPVSFTAARGVQTSTFTGWSTTTITAGNVYCFALTSPTVITSLTVKVDY